MWYAYALFPIDHHWEFLPSLNHVASEIGTNEATNLVLHGSAFLVDQVSSEQLAADWKRARTLAMQVGWEGDIIGTPSTFWLPGEDSFEFGFAFKQRNNGMTFIISPRALPWLEKRAAAMADSLDVQ